jgi:hypothetical protein
MSGGRRLVPPLILMNSKGCRLRDQKGEPLGRGIQSLSPDATFPSVRFPFRSQNLWDREGEMSERGTGPKSS